MSAARKLESRLDALMNDERLDAGERLAAVHQLYRDTQAFLEVVREMRSVAALQAFEEWGEGAGDRYVRIAEMIGASKPFGQKIVGEGRELAALEAEEDAQGAGE